MSALVSAFHVAIAEWQAKAVYDVLKKRHNNVTSLVNAQNAIEQVRRKYTRLIDTALATTLERMFFTDLEQQLRVVQVAKDKGKNISSPFFTKRFQLQVLDEINSERRFAEEIVRRLSVKGTEKLIDIVQMSREDLNRGEPIAGIARAAGQLIREEGISIQYPASGRVVRDPVAYMRRNLVTQISVDSGNRQKAIYDSLDVPAKDKWIETSSHMGARPDHAIWQGKIFKTWDEFVSVTRYGAIDGLGGINCRHRWYIFINGVSSRAFTTYDLADNERQYKQQQQQRQIEAKIRKYKLADAVSKEMGEGPRYGQKIRDLQADMRNLINTTGLTRRRDREQI